MLVVGICLIVLAAILIFLHVSSRKRIAALLVAKQKRFDEITHEKDLLAKELGGGSYEEFVSFEGNAVCPQPLISPIANVPCIHYEATVSREYEEEYED